MNKHYSNRQTYKRIVFQSTTNQPLHPIKNSSLTATIKTTDTWKKAKKKQKQQTKRTSNNSPTLQQVQKLLIFQP